ncbi:hypothetical protein ACIBO6_02315 [Streptomyces luteogriseus]|uniref:hypothetical protein n=1 Tax=Streptomyces luteogriseus TaxID=68233 RepID=UPI0037882489
MHLSTQAGFAHARIVPSSSPPASATNVQPSPAGTAPHALWKASPWLRNTRALRLDADCTAELGDYTLTYNGHTGLAYTRYK